MERLEGERKAWMGNGGHGGTVERMEGTEADGRARRDGLCGLSLLRGLSGAIDSQTDINHFTSRQSSSVVVDDGVECSAASILKFPV